jgi:ribulose-5-phosphate 4-epimerase/fuculose-1-phosphate aldolase
MTAAALIDELVAANRILYREGVVDGFGHVSVRSDGRPDRFLLSCSRAPGIVTADDILEHDLDGNVADARGRTLYSERFIHSEIYRRNPEIVSVVHSHSPSIIPFGVTKVALRPIFHLASFLGLGEIPVFEIRDAGGPATDLLIRDRPLGAALAQSLGKAPVALMRGHGDVVTGRSLREAVFRAIYTEVNARLQAQALQLGGGDIEFLTAGEAAAATATNFAVIERAWDLWRRQALAG